MTRNVWVLDSGCTHHMCFDKAYMKPVNNNVYLEDNNYVEVKGIGAVVLNFKDETGNYVKLTLSK